MSEKHLLLNLVEVRTGGGRVNVAAAQEELTKAISDMGQDPDSCYHRQTYRESCQVFR